LKATKKTKIGPCGVDFYLAKRTGTPLALLAAGNADLGKAAGAK
jgi:hypothetical protein